MAQITYQNTSLQLPDIGQVFRVKGDEGSIYKRVGNEIYQFDIVGSQGWSDAQKQAMGNYGVQLASATGQLKSNYGIDVNSLPQLEGLPDSALANAGLTWGKGMSVSEVLKPTTITPGQNINMTQGLQPGQQMQTIKTPSGVPIQTPQNINTLNQQPPTPQQVNIPGQAVAPTNASKITNTGALTIPNISNQFANMGDISGTTNFYKSMFDTLMKQQQDYQSQIQKQQETQQTQTKSFWDKITGGKSPQETFTDTMAQSGINVPEYFTQQKAQIDELIALNKQYDTIKSEMETKIMNTQDLMGTVAWGTKFAAKIEREYKPTLDRLATDIKSKAMVLEASQGRFDAANKYALQVAELASADLKYNMDMYKMIYDQNQDIIDKLDSDYKFAFQNAMNMAEKAYTQTYNEKLKIAELMIENPQANISVSDTFAQALTKIQASPKTNYNTSIVGSADTGYMSVTTDPQTGKVINQTPINLGGTGGEKKLTATQVSDLSEDLAAIHTFKTRDDALNFVKSHETAFITKYNKSSYDTLLKEVDRAFPVSTPPPSLSSTTGIKSLAKPVNILSGLPPVTPKQTFTEETGLTIPEGFFENLFGK